jgi:uncharacterized protein
MVNNASHALRTLSWWVVLAASIAAGGTRTTARAGEAMRPAPAERGGLLGDAIPGAAFRFTGVMGDRIEANLRNWLLPAPAANPGMLEMFRVRDRSPRPDLVPWAGEFVGKYLISAIQSLSLADAPELEKQVSRVIAAFLETQAEDGYLGPFRKEERLLGNWDLWGHYHAILALLMWHERTGDPKALRGAVAAGDLVCATFLDGTKRILDAGSPEMNMAIIHGLGRLYRTTGNERYLRMMREIELDWQKAGDYARTGLAGTPFYRTPRPRWESLHDVQGLVELYRITGDESYKKAFLNLWTSILERDRHPSGAFSTGEQAIGNPYGQGAIETCCTTAWMELTLDALRLSGDPRAADELELSTWNAVLGSQHPSGRWWTYNTPLDGVRQASAHTIVFQARHGTPELNCCSVNGPRGLGILSAWAAMRDQEGIRVNYYGPCEMRIPCAGGGMLTLAEETRYPAEGAIIVRLGKAPEIPLTLKFRIPAWSARSTVRLSPRGEAASVVGGKMQSGSYVSLRRVWHEGDAIELEFDLSLRSWAGELGRAGRASLYTGPILLGFDQHFNTIDTKDIPVLDLKKLDLTRAGEPRPGLFSPLVVRDVSVGEGRSITLCDFATCGAYGTDYVAWLPAINAQPAPFWLARPARGARIPAGPAIFEWTGFARAEKTYTLTIAKDPAFAQVVGKIEKIRTTRHALREGLAGPATYWWKVTATLAEGSADNAGGACSFEVDPALENTVDEEMKLYRVGPRGLVAASPLDGNGTPSFGTLGSEVGTKPARDRFGREGGAVAFSGSGCAITYRFGSFPERDYTFYAWVCPRGLPTDRLHQVVSAWCAGMDDPLRVVLQGAQVWARIEAQQVYGTEGLPAENGKWMHVAAVKRGARLEFYVNGELRRHVAVPEFIFSPAQDIAIGANPHFSGNECLVGEVDSFGFHGEALSADEIAAIYREGT